MNILHVIHYNQEQIKEQVKCTYSALGKAFEKQKQLKAIKNQGQLKTIKTY